MAFHSKLPESLTSGQSNETSLLDETIPQAFQLVIWHKELTLNGRYFERTANFQLTKILVILCRTVL